jgi:hypothetical protein
MRATGAPGISITTSGHASFSMALIANWIACHAIRDPAKRYLRWIPGASIATNVTMSTRSHSATAANAAI